MIFKRHIELKKGQLDIAPLIDVIFLLLIFFMLTSSFISSEGIKVKLPSAVSGKPLSTGGLVIYITDKGALTVNDKKTDIKRLKQRLKVAAEINSRILIKADKNTPLGTVIDIWDLCRDSGITNINIATVRMAKRRGL